MNQKKHHSACCNCTDCPCSNANCKCLTPSSSSTAVANSGCLCIACAHVSELILSVKGMTCSSCVETARGALTSKKGIISAVVNLLGERAQVRYYPHLIQPEKISDILDDIGFEAQPLTTSVKVQDSGADKLSLAIFELSSDIHPPLTGIRNSKVESRRLFVEFSPREMTLDQLRAQLPGAQFLDERPMEPMSGVSSSLNFTLHASREEFRATLQAFPPTTIAGVLFTKTHTTVNYFPHAIGARTLVDAVSSIASFRHQVDESSTKSPNLLRLLISLPLAAMIGLVVLIDACVKPIPDRVGILLLIPAATVLQFYCGLRFHQAAWNGIRTRHPTMDLLVSLSTTLGYLFGLLSVLLRSLNVIDRAGTVVSSLAQDMLMSAVLITVLLLGKSLEEHVKKRTTVAMRSLRSEGKLVTMLEGGQEKHIHPSLLHIGDQIVLRPGDNAPCDGVVITGDCSCDESLLTGESAPIVKAIGDTVLEGSTIADGYCILCVREVGSSTTLAQIRRLMEEAQLEPIKIQRVADSLAAVFVPSVLVITMLTWVAWTFIVSLEAVEAKETQADTFIFVMHFGLAVMLIACPCSFGLATPTAIMVATGVAAKFGCLVKSGEAFESVRKIRHIVLDKTGTITHGQPQVVETQLVAEVPLERFNQVLSSAERFSEHPIGKSLAKLSDADLPVTDWANVTGKGVDCVVDGMKVSVATLEPGIITSWSNASGATLVGLTVDDVLWGGVALRDSVKPEARATIEALKRRKIEIWMCTGDSIDAAHEVAREVNIAPENVRAKATPEAKSELVASLENVLMVGDGINDSIALAKADVGVAIGSGNHITMDSADVVLMKNNLNELKAFCDLGHATVWTIYRNFVWAFAFNIAGIPIAAGVGYPIKLTIPPLVAGIAMASSSIIVVCSSLMLYRFKV